MKKTEGWHNVRGVTKEELNSAEAETREKYGDLLDLPYAGATARPPMPMEKRAAQFLPFAALTGYEDAIEETGRLTESRIELGEDARAELDLKLREAVVSGRTVSITRFLQDPLKEGGAYVVVTGTIARIDSVAEELVLEDKMRIPLADVAGLA